MSTPYLIGLTGNIACGKSTVLHMLAARGAQVIDADAITHELQRPGEAVYTQIVAAFGSTVLQSPGGLIDRRALGAIVFSDPAQLRRLEQIVHPAVHARIMAWVAELGGAGGQGGRRAGENRRGGVSSPTMMPDAAPPPGATPPPPGAHPPPPAAALPSTAMNSPEGSLDATPFVGVIDAVKLLEAGWRPLLNAVWVVTCPEEQQLQRLTTTRGMSEVEARTRIAAQPPQSAKVAVADVVINNSGTLADTEAQVEAAWNALITPR